ncbi:histidine kinase [Rhodococcus sp. H29-C3]|uniref:sensor histidine kinase n=1 Tax=Rhodococcus sp. H29-C3 TaxID=3046307 RepID=UPI0024B8F3E4|nr:histidine kinase [Rhodococcus sp. H29-C3]MDJ0360274.1 histidine kinase [Rhodococcus sp. H29-C3]
MELRRYLDPRTSWRDTSEVDKVRLYTRQSLVVIVVTFGVAGLAETIVQSAWLSTAALIVSTATAVLVLQRSPGIGGMGTGDINWPLALSVTAAIVAGAAGGGATPFWGLMVVSVPVCTVISLRWALVLALVLGTATTATRYGMVGSAAAFFVVVFMATTVRLSIWLLRIVTELDGSRQAASQLSVAEERLRFSRDLHDVVGRALSAIAVKSELAAALSRRGDDRAAEQMDEVRELAQQSMTEARRLVRGYRSIDLEAEIEGACSLLAAAGIDTRVGGRPDAVASEFAEAAAWVVREGATNILRHSEATRCVIEVTAQSLRMVNDRPHGTKSGDGTGLAGLGERLAAVGGTVERTSNADEFALTATFAPRVAS